MEAPDKDIHHTFIELLAYWQGQVNATDLVKHFQRTRTQVQKYIQSYKNKYPDNLLYDHSKKAFIPSSSFIRYCISGNVNQYLHWLDTNDVPTAQTSTATLTHTSLNIPPRQVSPQVMRGLVMAIKRQYRLDVDYVSLTNPDSNGRVIQPYMFVKTGLRWHLRAFDEQHQQFRDFVLSRFRGEPELLDKATQDTNQDRAWSEYIDLIFEPDSRLTPDQKRVLEQDYQMVNGQLAIKTRAALASYVIQEMQVNIKFHDADPTAQQLVLANKKDIKQWLFNA
jgi:hypothetical protein